VLADRRERGAGTKSALAELEEDYGIRVFPIVNIYEIVGWLHGREIDGKVVITDEIKVKIDRYLETYGA
jgi:orotate phosphoribosyltransferase